MRQQKPFAAKWFPALAAFILTMTLAVGPGFAQMGRGRGFVTASLASKSMSWREPRKWKRRSETFSIRTLTAFRNQDDSEVDEEAIVPRPSFPTLNIASPCRRRAFCSGGILFATPCGSILWVTSGWS